MQLVGGGATVNLSKMLKQMSKISNDLQWVWLPRHLSTAIQYDIPWLGGSGAH